MVAFCYRFGKRQKRRATRLADFATSAEAAAPAFGCGEQRFGRFAAP
jgi:hypothetical protein